MAARRYLAPLAVLLAACGSDTPPEPADAQALGRIRDALAGARAALEEQGAPAGTLTGLVLFDGLPTPRTPIETSAEGGCGMDPAEPPLTETLVVDQARLANVFVWIENPPASAVPPGVLRRELTQ